MTKKHFIEIAACFKRQMAVAPSEAHYSIRTIAEALCVTFKAQNPAFDKARFLTACGF